LIASDATPIFLKSTAQLYSDIDQSAVVSTAFFYMSTIFNKRLQ